MKIGIQTWGSDGDILPFLALAIGLRQSGHKVTVVYTSVDNKNYLNVAAPHEIATIRVVDRFEEDGAELFRKITATRNPLEQLTLVLENYFVPAIDDMYAAAQKLCRENDLVIGHAIHYPLATAAEKANCPRVAVTLCPMTIETSQVSPFDTNLGKWLNSLLWKWGDRLVRQKIYGPADALRQREGLPPFTYLQDDLYVTKKLTLIAASTVLCPRQPDWGEHIRVCGFLNPPATTDDWELPQDLQRFLESGPPPVYFTFGSCTQFAPEGTTRLFLECAKRAGVRAIIQSNWDGFSLSEEDPDIYRVQSIPHEHVFPHCAMIVHHGGAGTTHASLRAGKPSVVVAHAYDQPFWGRRLMKLGVAGNVLSRRRVTAEALAKMIRSVQRSPQMSSAAQEASELMERESGVDTAVTLINQIFQKESGGPGLGMA